jgi:hypothetical protein
MVLLTLRTPLGPQFELPGSSAEQYSEAAEFAAAQVRKSPP